MPISRRTALKSLALAGASVTVPRRLQARPATESTDDLVSVLYDSTRCVGCKNCVRGCREVNGCSTPEDAITDLGPDVLSILTRHDCADGGHAYLKTQCMHCVDPACVSACMLGAMHKDAQGAVVWNADLCVGCRYCQIACPYVVPRFEWDTPVPELAKCQLCPELRAQGKPPACVANCKRGALVYGTRRDMLDVAHRRIAADPDGYNPKVYGEFDGGGTQVLYLARAGVSFAEMGLPELGQASVAVLPEKIQHTLYKGFVAPLALFGTLALVVRRNTRAAEQNADAGAPSHEVSTPVGGRLFTWPFIMLGALALLGALAVLWRFGAGLGATTNLNDGYPMGLWIAFDVVTGTALACGGYAVALLVYLLNKGKYHPLVRAAVVTSALGYTLGGISVLIDIGRPWNFYKIPLYFWDWNFNSILLEVALCIMIYTMVLWIEVAPAFLDRWRESERLTLRRTALALTPRLERAMPWVIALGMVLPTMHQSSLGSLMMLAGQKLHPLWQTPLLPALFLISCVGMGYAIVTVESTLSARVFKRPAETPMLRSLGVPIAAVLLAYGALRVGDVVYRGRLGQILAGDFYSWLFGVEMALMLVPALLLLFGRHGAGPLRLALGAVAVVLGGALYRFSTYLIAFNPGERYSYFPALPEFAVTVGLVAAEIMGYLVIVKYFPILRAHPAAVVQLQATVAPHAPARVA
ncbi:MAG: Ni/Fe-hydrogenase cytochrome b subunit [Gemmatimonadota bacterium]